MACLQDRVDIHLVIIAGCCALPLSAAAVGLWPDTWVGRHLCYVALAVAGVPEWLLGLWWWERHRNQSGSRPYLIANQAVIALLFGLVVTTSLVANYFLFGSY